MSLETDSAIAKLESAASVARQRVGEILTVRDLEEVVRCFRVLAEQQLALEARMEALEEIVSEAPDADG
jgi:hypothetical protein